MAFNVAIGIQARINSTRFPGKVLKKIGNKTIIEHIYEKCCLAKNADTCWILTGSEDKNKELIELCKKKTIPIIIGDEYNVLSRYETLQKKTNADILVRLTGDNPLVQTEMIDKVLSVFNNIQDLDYVSNCVYQDFPLGLNVEAFTKKALISLLLNHDEQDKEHVTIRFKKKSENFKIYHIKAPKDLHWPKLRLTIDQEEDFEFINNLYKKFGNKIWDIDFLIKYLRKNTNVISNLNVKQKGF